jgi:hypothetical protein
MARFRSLPKGAHKPGPKPSRRLTLPPRLKLAPRRLWLARPGPRRPQSRLIQAASPYRDNPCINRRTRSRCHRQVQTAKKVGSLRTKITRLQMTKLPIASRASLSPPKNPSEPLPTNGLPRHFAGNSPQSLHSPARPQAAGTDYVPASYVEARVPP